jgi:hypothetical protein
VNARLGGRRLLSHAIFTPGRPGWMEALERALDLRPDSLKGYTIGDNQQGPELASVAARRREAENAVFGEDVARLYRYDRRAELGGARRLPDLKAGYERSGIGRSNRRYGYVVNG